MTDYIAWVYNIMYLYKYIDKKTGKANNSKENIEENSFFSSQFRCNHYTFSLVQVTPCWNAYTI